MCAVVICDDIFEYVANHMSNVHIIEYNKLKAVSVKFNMLFTENYKKYAKPEDINKYYNNRISVIKSDILDKYGFNKCKDIDNTLDCDWYHNRYHSISHHINSIIMNKCGICIEYLIALLYNSQYMKHRNVIEIFRKIAKHIAIYPIDNVSLQNNIFDVITLCCKILDLQSKRQGIYKSTYKYVVYNTNIFIYISILLKALHNSSITYNELPSRFNTLLFSLDEFKNIIMTNPRYPKIFPKYYLKAILEIIEDSYI